MSNQAVDTINIPTVGQGDRGSAVNILQLLLNNFHGYSIQVDGDFGPETENAVRDFQSSHNLTLTGVVNYATWQALATAD